MVPCGELFHWQLHVYTISSFLYIDIFPLCVAAGSSYNALQFGTYEGSELSDRDYQLYDKDGGVGLLDGFIIDAHFR